MLAAAALAIGLASVGGPVAAQTKISLGYTATLGFNGAFIAKDQGFFQKHGLDVELTLIGLNSNIPGALMGNSIQIGGPTPPVLMQANDGGLDLVVIANCSVTDPNNTKDGVMVRSGVSIKQPADFIGKKVGVPGLNAFLHVMFRQWLLSNGVDYEKVNFVEVPFTQSADVLRSGSVDAVITGEPFSTRIVADNIGTLAVPLAVQAPPNIPAIFYASTRDWAKAHPDAVRAFHEAIAEAGAFQAKDPAAARVSASKFIKLPPEVLNTITLPVLQADVSDAQLQYWVDALTRQKMLQEKPDVAKLLVK